MRWITTEQTNMRTVRKFAWFPVRCEGGITVWLEMYTATQQWQYGYEFCGWVSVCKEAD